MEENDQKLGNIEKDIENAGLKTGILKSKVKTKEIINNIRLQRKDVAWIGIELKGTNAIVKLVKADEKPEIIDENEYPLLSDTLKQTLIYYHIRMKVEHELVDIFNIHCTSNEILMLINIIQNAFRVPTNATQEQINEARQNRVFFTSRKTLLNEFNHFEGNMNIFQPAIDINETVLQKEVTDIENKLKELRNKYAQIY